MPERLIAADPPDDLILFPATLRSPAIVVRPLACPIFVAVDAPPPMLRVVTPELRRLKVAAEEVKSPPLTAISPLNVVVTEEPANVVVPFIVTVSTEESPSVVLPSTINALLIEVVPVAAPISNVVAAPPTLRVVTVEFKRLNVVALDVRSPPLTAISPAVVMLLLSSITTPEPCINFPVVESNLAIVLSIALAGPTTSPEPPPPPAASAAVETVYHSVSLHNNCSVP